MRRIAVICLIGAVVASAAAIALSAAATKTPEPTEISAGASAGGATFQERWDALDDRM